MGGAPGGSMNQEEPMIHAKRQDYLSLSKWIYLQVARVIPADDEDVETSEIRTGLSHRGQPQQN